MNLINKDCYQVAAKSHVTIQSNGRSMAANATANAFINETFTFENAEPPRAWTACCLKVPSPVASTEGRYAADLARENSRVGNR